MSVSRKKNKSIGRFLIAKENRLGVVILCIGFFALIWVSFKAYDRYFAFDNPPQTLYSAANVPTPPPQFVEQVKVKKPKYKKQSEITLSEITGAWDIVNEQGRSIFQLSSDGSYKFAYISQNRGIPNRYSMGNFILKDGLLIFTPHINKKLGREQFPGYLNLTKAKFPIAVARSGRKLILYKPNRSFGVYVPPTHPFFTLMPDDIVKFSTLR